MNSHLFKLIARNMRRSLRRTLLTMFTIALATFIFTVLISVPASIDRIVSRASTTLRLVINNKTAPWYDLPARYCDQIKALPGCAACVAITGWPASWQNVSEPVFVAAAGPEIGAVFPDYALSPMEQRAIAKERRSAVVGELLMKKYHWKVGQQITLHGSDFPAMDLTFVILGVTQSQHYPNTFLMNRSYLMESYKAHGMGNVDFAWQLMVRADDSDHLPMLAREIDEHFANSDAETRSESESDMLSTGLSALGNVREIIFSLCAIVVLTVMLIAANSTAMMVRERISEVAVMRAIGFDRGTIAWLLFGECVLIGLVGGAVGAGLAYRLLASGQTLGPVLDNLGALYVMPEQALTGLAAATFVSIVSGLIPIAGALRIAPALAFREIV